MNNVSLFLDSGAHSLYTKEVINKGHSSGFDYYKTKEFWNYVDEYALFVKKNIEFLSVYANVDVIFNPELTWGVQKYLEEKYGLSPLPVVHFGESFDWLEKYMACYEYIALGGLGQEVSVCDYVKWGDRAFDFICNTTNRTPKVKVHGFALTSLRLMLRYPWYSVDSTSWVLTGRFGSVFVPREKGGKYIYDENSWKVCVSTRSPSKIEEGKHITTFSEMERRKILDYFDYKGYKLGRSEFRKEDEKYKLKDGERWFGKAEADSQRNIHGEDWKDGYVRDGWSKERVVENVIEPGLSNDYKQRDELNIIYFLDLEKSMPEWPWPFKLRKSKGFGLGR